LPLCTEDEGEARGRSVGKDKKNLKTVGALPTAAREAAREGVEVVRLRRHKERTFGKGDRLTAILLNQTSRDGGGRQIDWRNNLAGSLSLARPKERSNRKEGRGKEENGQKTGVRKWKGGVSDGTRCSQRLISRKKKTRPSHTLETPTTGGKEHTARNKEVATAMLGEGASALRGKS